MHCCGEFSAAHSLVALASLFCHISQDMVWRWRKYGTEIVYVTPGELLSL